MDHVVEGDQPPQIRALINFEAAVRQLFFQRTEIFGSDANRDNQVGQNHGTGSRIMEGGNGLPERPS